MLLITEDISVSLVIKHKPSGGQLLELLSITCFYTNLKCTLNSKFTLEYFLYNSGYKSITIYGRRILPDQKNFSFSIIFFGFHITVMAKIGWTST